MFSGHFFVILKSYIHIFTDGSFAAENGSKRTSSEISLQTQKFVDRNKWLQEMAQLESKRSGNPARSQKRSFSYQQTDSAQSSYHDNDHSKNEWQYLDIDDSLSSCNVSSDISFKTLQDEKENTSNSHVTKQNNKIPAKNVRNKRTDTSLQLQIERLKDLIRKQRLSSINRLLREVKKIERLENMIPNLKQSETDYSPSSNQSEVMYHMNKSPRHRSANNSSRNDSPSHEFQTRKKSNFESQKKSKEEEKIQTHDFTQLFPSPCPPELLEKTSKNGFSSIGLQTTPSLNGIDDCLSVHHTKKSVKVKKPIGWVIPVSRRSPAPLWSLKLEENLTLQVNELHFILMELI